MGRGRRPKLSQRRAKGWAVESLKKTFETIERLPIKRGWDTGRRVDNLLRQQRDEYKEIIDFYRTKRYGYLDRRGKDRIIPVFCVENPEGKFKNVAQEVRNIIRGMIKGKLSEKDGCDNLKKLEEKTGVFRVISFDLTSSEGSKWHKEERNRKKAREKAEPILVLEPGEKREISLRKLRKIEGIT